MLTTRQKKLIINEHKSHDTDSGSTSVQIALITKRIKELVDHLKKNSKDNHSRRGLLKMVGKRRRLMKYLASKDEKGYATIVKKLDL